MDDEPRRADVGLDDVFWLWAGVFEAGGRMFNDGFAEDLVEFGSFDFLMSGGVDVGGELKEAGDILTGFGTSDENGCVRQKVKVLFELIEDFVGI